MDELEQRIRAARPNSGHRDLALSDRAKRELAELLLIDAVRSMRRPRRIRPPRLRRTAGIAAALSAAVTAGVLTTTALLSAGPAYAATPQMLQVSTTPESAQELLSQMSEAAEGRRAPSNDSEIKISVQTWTLQTDDDGIATSSSIVPENYEFIRRPDGSFATTVTYAQPVDEEGIPTRDAGLPSPGELNWKGSWAPGEYQYLFPTPFPEHADAVNSFLSTLSESSGTLSASAAVQAASSLLMEQKLSPAQEVCLLAYLAGLPDLKVGGTVVDRLGRDGVLFTSEDPDWPGYRDHFIVSLSGEILATERIYNGNTRTDIPSPSVISYYLWK